MILLVVFEYYFVSCALLLDQPIFWDCCQQQLHLSGPSTNNCSPDRRSQVPSYHLICSTMKVQLLAVICACKLINHTVINYVVLQHWGSDFSCTNTTPSNPVPTSGEFLKMNTSHIQIILN